MLLHQVVINHQAALACALAVEAEELDDTDDDDDDDDDDALPDHRDNDHSVNLLLGAVDSLKNAMTDQDSQFLSRTNFRWEEWQEFAPPVCDEIIRRARSGHVKTKRGRPPKLTPEQRLMSTVLLLKKGNTAREESGAFNWSRTSVNADSTFVMECICAVWQAQEIRWPTAAERVVAGRREPDLEGCVGCIEGTLCRIERPSTIGQRHIHYFNGRKKMYCMNSTVVIDHDGLFIDIDAGYAGSFHDVTILRHSPLYRTWQQRFTRDPRNNYIEYLLGHRKCVVIHVRPQSCGALTSARRHHISRVR